MSRDHLTPELITDRNGVITTRWVKQGDALSGASRSFQPPMPAPATAQISDERLAQKLRDEIYSSLGDVSASDRQDIFDAHNARDIGLLTAFARNAPHQIRLSEVKLAYRMLERAGYDKPEDYLTPEAVAFSTRLSVALVEINDAKRIDMGNPLAAIETLCFALTTSAEDQPLVERIVTERRIAKVDEVRELLEEMKKDATALSEGKL